NDVIQCGGIKLAPGDIIVGDETGLVVVPRNKATEVLKTATELVEAEKRFEKLVEQGRTFGDAARELLHM
ncbi:MAG: bifunctional hexulose-6-phosphate synthase/ribonuclease regulator, partial [Aigarchaeota archaeon]|nr:bifunctional hexulose-6-phosphate synthase/ribonuclease regulator [Aigarchaeota archaeon]